MKRSLMKAGIFKGAAACGLLTLSVLPTGGVSLAQDSNEIAAVQAQLQAAKGGEQDVSQADLEKAQRILAEAEAALLRESQAAKQPKAAMEQHDEQPRAAVKDQLVDQQVDMLVAGKARIRPEEQLAEISEERSRIQSQLQQSSAQLETVQLSKAATERRLVEAEGKIAKLKRELSEAKSRLMIAETEVERLSKMVEARGRSFTTRSNVVARTDSQLPVAAGRVESSSSGTLRPIPSRSQKPRQDSAATTVAPEPSSDMPVATVIADKAHLRAGPGKDHSPLAAVAKGTRLVVETREGEWMRVISPTGARAWVSTEVVAFGPSFNSAPTSTVRVKAYDPTLEDRAFELIKSRGN